MNAIITTTLSYFNMLGIKPIFSVLARESGIDRHTLKKPTMQVVIRKGKKEYIKVILMSIELL